MGVSVRGPVTGGSHGWPFGGADPGDLAAHGYVEEEYVLSGDATRYRLTDAAYGFDGRWTVEPAGSAPFRTRMVVRRPSDPSRFNGTVIVGWSNVSSGYDSVGGEREEIFAGGFAFAGVSAQRVGVHGLPFGEPLGLASWDPPRYGQLSLPDDDYSFDVFTQAARVLRARARPDPLGGSEPARLVAWGRSQSALRLATYHNALQPVTGSFDGFLLEVYHGGGTMVSSLSPGGEVPEIPEDVRPVVNLLPYGSHLLRTDLRQPVMVVNSETEVPPGAMVRQPDSATYRLWEVAGAAHIGPPARARAEALQRRDFGALAPQPWDVPDDAGTLSMDPVYDAALHHLQRWLVAGSPPPSQPRVELAGTPPEIVRDALGNAVGGIRLPDLEVPTATHRGASPRGETPNLSGRSTPLTPEALHSLYPDRRRYLDRFAAAVRAGVDAGFLLPRDAERLSTDSSRDDGTAGGQST